MEQSPTPRESARRAWLNELGWRNYLLQPASEDASFRSYWRVQGTHSGQPRCQILMDAPPDRENSQSFVKIAALLRRTGLHSPEIFAQNTDQGFLLLEDLGNITYADLDPSQRAPHYERAVQALAQAQSISCATLPAYDETLLRNEMALFPEWLLSTHLNLSLNRNQIELWESTMQLLCDNALEQPQVFVHRDYHSRNLMVTDKNSPGIIDFQDAVRGPISYDLVSLLRDCYWRCPPELLDSLLNRFIQNHHTTGVVAEASRWQRWFDLMGVQRHLKASGIFCRLNYRDGKPNYLHDIPLTLNYVIDVAKDYRELAWLGEYLLGKVLARLVDRSR